MKHYLYNEDEEIITEFPQFDREAIKEAIVDYLLKNPNEEVDHVKDYTPAEAKKYAGKKYLSSYRINPSNGAPSKIVPVGNKEFYKAISSQRVELTH